MKSFFRFGRGSQRGVSVRRLAFFLAGDTLLLVAVLYLALLLRFEGNIPGEVLATFPIALGVSLAVKIPLLYWQRLYSMSWSYVGMEDLVAALRGITLGSLVFAGVVLGLRSLEVLTGFPRGALVIDYALTLLAIGGFRLSRRTLRHLFRRPAAKGRPVLVVGAGAVGEQLVRAVLASPDTEYNPVGFLDDDPAKQGTSVHRVPVLGPRSELINVVQRRQIPSVFIAMPSAPSRIIRETVELARTAGVGEVRIIPGLDRIVDGKVTLANLREVQLSDLLGRQVVSSDEGEISAYLRDRVVLVTGAGGSIGSELCRQILRFAPARLIALDHEETALFDIQHSLGRSAPVDAVLGDIRDARAMAAVLRGGHPSVIFHAAAYKHVALMERHPHEAVRTNVGGTLVVARAACQAGVEKFVLISTDKAVNPTSVMGTTKRVAEQVCLALGGASATRFVAVRFGNVLGSRGSVVPIFQEQIRRGGPVTVRGPKVRRYFMAISEAVLLVLQAGAMGEGGEVFVLDMGEQMYIADLAKELILLSGLEPDRDIPIVYTELEPGEKESEDVLAAEEGTVATHHERIHVARLTSSESDQRVLQRAEALLQVAELSSGPELVRALQELVPTYRPSALALGLAASQPPLPVGEVPGRGHRH